MLNKHCSYHFYLVLAVIIVTAPLSVAEESEPAQTPSALTETVTPIEEQVKLGERLFNNLCKVCHTTTYVESPTGAPGLRSVLERHDEAWLDQWIKSPASFAKTNVAARDLIDSNPFGLAMPTLPMMQDDANRSAIIEYLKTLK